MRRVTGGTDHVGFNFPMLLDLFQVELREVFGLANPCVMTIQALPCRFVINHRVSDFLAFFNMIGKRPVA